VSWDVNVGMLCFEVRMVRRVVLLLRWCCGVVVVFVIVVVLVLVVLTQLRFVNWCCQQRNSL
jgi:hypothetical protein